MDIGKLYSIMIEGIEDLKEKELDKELEERERIMRNEQMKAFPLTEEEIEKLKKEKRI